MTKAQLEQNIGYNIGHIKRHLQQGELKMAVLHAKQNRMFKRMFVKLTEKENEDES